MLMTMAFKIACKPKHCRNLKSSELLLKSVYCVGSIFMQLILCAWLHVEFFKVVSMIIGLWSLLYHESDTKKYDRVFVFFCCWFDLNDTMKHKV